MSQTAVLGSPITRGAAVARALLISDLHLADVRQLPPLGGVLRAARRTGASVFVLGDLFDSYVSRGQVRVGVWRATAGLLADAAADGVDVTVLRGNRDFLLGEEFETAARVRLLPGGYRGSIGGVDTLLLHGDELCQNDLPYQRAKRWLRHPWTRVVARRLPVALARRAAARARQRSRQVIASGNQERFLPSAAAIAIALVDGVQRLVFGHVHRASAGRVGDAWCCILPAFDEQLEGLGVGGGEGGALQAAVTLDGPGPFGAVRFDPDGGTVPVGPWPGLCLGP